MMNQKSAPSTTTKIAKAKMAIQLYVCRMRSASGETGSCGFRPPLPA
jgi:hypothetical protein